MEEKTVELENKGRPTETDKEKIKGAGGEGAKAQKGYCSVHSEIVLVIEKEGILVDFNNSLDI